VIQVWTIYYYKKLTKQQQILAAYEELAKFLRVSSLLPLSEWSSHCPKVSA
jgi:hypothetical protein